MVIDVEAMKMPAKKQMLANTYEYTQKEIRKSLLSITALIIVIIENIFSPLFIMV